MNMLLPVHQTSFTHLRVLLVPSSSLCAGRFVLAKPKLNQKRTKNHPSLTAPIPYLIWPLPHLTSTRSFARIANDPCGIFVATRTPLDASECRRWVMVSAEPSICATNDDNDDLMYWVDWSKYGTHKIERIGCYHIWPISHITMAAGDRCFPTCCPARWLAPQTALQGLLL
jgi:hypothetical protein